MLEISSILMEFFVVFSKCNLFLELPWYVGMILVFLEVFQALSNAYEKIKIFEIIESRNIMDSE